MKNILPYFIFILFSPAFGQKTITPKTYTAFQTSELIKIDGKASEKAWEQAEWSEEFIDIEGIKEPDFQTNFKMLWDEENLFFFAKMEEPHVWATLKQRDTVIFYNNDFEIFIDPDGDTHNYYEIEINALNTLWDLFLLKPYREGAPVVDSWDIRGIESAVFVDGSLNDPQDTDKGWNLEIAIPWEVLTEATSHGGIPKDEFWRINFSRVNWQFQLEGDTYSRKKDEKGNYLPEYNWVWSPQGVINMHEPEHWGYVHFSTKTNGSTDSFSIPKDEKIKWLLYELYNAQKKYYSSHKKWADNIEDLYHMDFNVLGNKIEPNIEIHRTGWNISVTSPFTGHELIIKQDGDFLTQTN